MDRLTTDPKGKEGLPVEETKEALTPTKEELLEGLETSFTVEELNEEQSQRLKSDILQLVKHLSKEQQQLFQNLAIICIETERDGHRLSDFYGLDLAIQQLGSDPTKKIILTGMMFSEVGRKLLSKEKPDQTTFLFNSPRVKTIDLIQLLAHPEKLVELVVNEPTQEQHLNKKASEEAFIKQIETKIQIFFHNAHHWNTGLKIDRQQSSATLQAFFALPNKHSAQVAIEEDMLHLLNIQHPEYGSLSREEKLEKIVAFAELADKITLPEGRRFEGVFVDRDGTLYDVEKKELNPKTLDIIKQFQSEGKEVTVRTLGDVAKVQALLDEANIPLKVKSKVEFKGGTVEIAVDDLSEEELFTIINVKAEKYIQV